MTGKRSPKGKERKNTPPTKQIVLKGKQPGPIAGPSATAPTPSRVKQGTSAQAIVSVTIKTPKHPLGFMRKILEGSPVGSTGSRTVRRRSSAGSAGSTAARRRSPAGSAGSTAARRRTSNHSRRTYDSTGNRRSRH